MIDIAVENDVESAWINENNAVRNCLVMTCPSHKDGNIPVPVHLGDIW